MNMLRTGMAGRADPGPRRRQPSTQTSFFAGLGLPPANTRKDHVSCLERPKVVLRTGAGIEAASFDSMAS